MKQLSGKVFYLLVYLFLSHPGWAQSRKVLFVIADGIPADVIEKVHTPYLDSIAAEGRYLRAYVGGEKGGYSQTPTVSAVGYNSLITGTWANKHNVWDNNIAAPNYHYWNLFRLLKHRFPQKKTAVFSSWLENRTRLVGAGLPEAGGMQTDYHADGYERDTLRFPHDPQRLYMHRIDEKVTEEAVQGIRAHAPDLSWVYLEYTDDMGHLHGDGPAFYDAVKKMDAQVGRIWNAIRFRQKRHGEEWLLVVTTDHGRDEETGKGHGGQSPRQRSAWIVTNYPRLNTYAQYFQPGVVDLMPTMARFLGLPISRDQAREVDGVPLIGPVSLAGAAVNYFQGTLDVSWKALAKKGTVKIHVAATNHFATGGADTYHLLAEVPLQQEHAQVDVRHLPAGFYKVVLEGADNVVNRWVTTGGTQKQ